MIAARSIEFAYRRGGFRLRIGELGVKKGEKVAIIGPSGCGKTTLLNLVAGILTPIKGTVSVGGIPVSQLGDADRRDFRVANIGFVFQDFGLIDYLSVRDNILHSHRMARGLRLDREVRRRAAVLAERMGIAGKLKARAADLSEGERQRVATCRALLHRPAVICADEAMGNLDPFNKGRTMDMLFDFVEEHGATLLAVTDDYELLECFDRTIDLGRLSKEGQA